jgi:predicted MPP superfamily phosphohydrolase
MLRILLTPFTPRHDSNPLNVAGMATAYAWHLLVLPFTLLVIGVHSALSPILRRARLALARPPAEPIDIGKPRLHRREILVAVPPLLAGAALGVSLGELHRFRIRRMEVPLRALPAALDGMTIAHVCDTHIGRFTDAAMLRDVAAAANSLEADLTLFIGDLIDVALADLGPAIEFARRLRGRYGVVFCEGNHDVIEDRTHQTNFFETRTRDAGLSILFDESTIVRVRDQPVQLLGGRWNQRPRERSFYTQQLMKQVDPNAFPIFLSHHPHGWDDSTTPLTLSGHTHGGQLMLCERVGVGPIMFKYWSGIYRRNDQALVVCNGAGNWFPLRTCAPAEIIHLTLRTM